MNYIFFFAFLFLSCTRHILNLKVWVEQEDMVAQLRLTKRRLQEAEEEQYKVSNEFSDSFLGGFFRGSVKTAVGAALLLRTEHVALKLLFSLF